MTYAKPWEKSPNRPVQKAKIQAAAKPWEPPLPDVSDEELDEYRERANRGGHYVRLDALLAQGFAKHYVTRFDIVHAMLAMGWAEPDEDFGIINKRGRRYLNHPLVREAISNYQQRFSETDILTRDRILAGLYEEAADRSPFTTSASRVAAWSKLAHLTGMDEAVKPKKEEPKEAKSTSGVMLIPYMGGVDEWEAAAMGSQAKLKADVRT